MHKTLVNNVINYQPQLETRISEPSTVVHSSISPVGFSFGEKCPLLKMGKELSCRKGSHIIGVELFAWHSRNTKPDMLSVLCLLFLLCLMWKSHTSHSAKKDGDCDISFQTPKTPWKFSQLCSLGWSKDQFSTKNTLELSIRPEQASKPLWHSIVPIGL